MVHVMPMPPASMCALKFLTGMEATCMDRGGTNENVSIYTYVHTIGNTNYRSSSVRCQSVGDPTQELMLIVDLILRVSDLISATAII